MRVVHIVWSYKLGGAELFAWDIAQYQARQGHDVTFVMLAGAQMDLPDPCGVKLKSFSMRSALDIRELYTVYSFLSRREYDVIHHHQCVSALFPVSFSKGCAVVVKHEHGIRRAGWKSAKEMLVSKCVSRVVDLYIANSKATAEMLKQNEGVADSRVAIVYCGVELNKFKEPIDGAAIRDEVSRNVGFDRTDPVVLYVSRLVKNKGLSDYLEIVKTTLELDSRVKFWIVGDGELRESLELRAKDMKVSGSITFLGYRKDIPALMKAANCFAITSRWEGFGITAVEAMAAGLPIVSFDSGGVVEAIGDAGRVVIGRDCEAFAREIVACLHQDGDARSREVKSGLERAQHFSLEAVCESISSLYRNIKDSKSNE